VTLTIKGKTMRNRLLLISTLPLLLAGCGFLSRPFVPVRYYSIDPPALQRRTDAVPGGLVIAVRTLAAAPRYRDRVLYRRGELAAGYHENDRWIEPPAELVTAVLRRAIEATGAARIVADDRLVRRPDFVLDGRLARFDEVQGRDAWTAECEIELLLKQAEDTVILLAERFAARREARAKSTAAFAEAMNAAVTDATAKAADALAKALADRKPSK